ncbi:hypothetical protein FACS189425_07750 [Clostridia bacterium]|nr:hypothetical protein FACS189425_07750 [Clostridia bacterium]
MHQRDISVLFKRTRTYYRVILLSRTSVDTDYCLVGYKVHEAEKAHGVGFFAVCVFRFAVCEARFEVEEC